MKIITNHHKRPILYGYELTEKERKDFDYLDDIDAGSFFRYKGCTYDLSEFLRIEKHAALTESPWDGYHADSFFSSVLVRYADDFEAVVVGLALS